MQTAISAIAKTVPYTGTYLRSTKYPMRGINEESIVPVKKTP